ncbi:MAG: tetratricopeptide repeat protein [Desulfosudaceae bacterium]
MLTGPKNNGCFGRHLLVLILLGVLLAGPGFDAGQTASARTVIPEEQLGLADHFFSRDDYGQARVEYETFCYLFADHPQVDYARFRIGLTYFKQARYEQALEEFQALAAAAETEEFRTEPATSARFMVSQCYAALGLRSPAVANLKRLLETTGDTALRDRAYYHLAWIYLETAPELDPAAMDAAVAYFEKISPDNRDYYRVETIRERLAAGRTGRRGELADRKSPALAGGLAVFPGAGYLYCGRYRDALVSFLFNGGMIWAAVEAYDNDLEVLGTMIALADFGFYAGSIYGSTAAAHKLNRRRSRHLIQDLDGIRISIIPVHQGRGVMAGVTVPF